jgi:hypothetical protein
MESPVTQETSVQSNDLFKHAAKFGAIMGLIGIVVVVLIYAVDYTIMASMWFGLLLFAFYIGYVIYAGINYRNQSGGFINYGKAFQHSYVTFLVGGVIGSIFSILLYTVIDPSLPENLTDAIVENTEQMMQKFGAPEDQIDKQLDQMRIDMPQRFSAMGVLKQFGWGLLIYAVLSAITALVVKKKEPELM